MEYICFFSKEKYLTSATASQASNHGRMDATCARAVRRSSRIHPKLGSNYPKKKKTKYGVRTSTIAVVYVCLSPSTAAWPGSVIEDDLVRKSEGQSGQRMQAAVPARHGSRRRPQPSRQPPASQPATARTPTWRRLYRLVRRGLAPIHPTPTRSGHIVSCHSHRGKKGSQPAGRHVSTPYRSELFQLFFFTNY